MGFRGSFTTSSWRRTEPWPEWFVGKWGQSVHFHENDTLCNSKHQIKNISGFADDYSAALSEIGWKPPTVQTRHRVVEIVALWECGGVDTREFMPGDKNIFYNPANGYELSHGDHCDHGWKQ